jgi:hypothetical protein
MRYGAPRIVRPRRHNTMVDDRTEESELGQIIRPEELVIDRVTRGNTAGSPAQKLPRTAIYGHFEAAKPLLPFQPSISLPFQVLT